VAEKFGASGEILADYVRWLVGRIRDLAPSPGYRPRLHLDLYGCAGLAFGGDTDVVAVYLAELGKIAQPYDLAIEHPIDAGAREVQIETFRRLRDRLSELGSGVRVVVDEWCNTLDDVRAFIAAGAAESST
jgi:methylaspartate ammonia-lyase